MSGQYAAGRLPPAELVWRPHQEVPPPEATAALTDVTATKCLLYPYWFARFEVVIKAPLLPSVARPATIAVDGLSGDPCLVQARYGDGEPGHYHQRLTSISPRTVPFALPAQDVDWDRVERVLTRLISKRLKTWSNASLEFREARPSFKHIHLFTAMTAQRERVEFCLDTLSGEMGVLDSTSSSSGSGTSTSLTPRGVPPSLSAGPNSAVVTERHRNDRRARSL